MQTQNDIIPFLKEKTSLGEINVNVKYNYVNETLYSNITELDTTGVIVTSYMHGQKDYSYHIRYELLSLSLLQSILKEL